MNRRKPAGPAWNGWRIFMGLAYVAAAVFNSTYTLQHANELDGYAEGAWFGFLQDFMWEVFMPNGELFMIMVITFEVIVAGLILSRRRAVDVGVTLSVLWVVGILPFLAWPYLLTNVVLAVAQGVILLRRYDVSLWGMARNLMGAPGAPHPS